MATFPSITPTYGAQKRSNPKVKVVQYGDGYQQRIRFGAINNDPKSWSLNWDNITETDSDTIENFLVARGAAETFDWTPPDESTAYKWVCSSWAKTIPYTGRSNISATFTQVFEP